VPALPGERGAVRVCLLLSDRGGPCELRSALDSTVYLGALVDTGGVVHRWLELHEQAALGPGLRAQAAPEVLNNALMDSRWEARARRLAKVPEAGVVRAGEADAPGGRGSAWRVPPMVLDTAKGEVVAAIDGEGRAMKVCTDDAALRARDLAAFASTRHRYLIAEGDDPAKGVLVRLDADAPRDHLCKEPAEALGLSGTRRGWCLAGGLLVTAQTQVSLERYCDALSAIAGLSDERPVLGALLEAAESAKELGDGSLSASSGGAAGAIGGQAFLSRRGPFGAALEVLHHKLALLLDVTEQARAAVASSQEPLLNLSAGSVRVVLGATGAALPAFWSSRAVLTEAGAGAVMPVAGTAERLYVNLSSGAASVYQPSGGGAATVGYGTLRIRRVMAAAGGSVLEGTLTTQDRVRGSSRDCVWMRLPTEAGRCDLLCRVQPGSMLASGEVRLVSFEHALGPEASSGLKKLEGQQIHDVLFELAPLHGSPADLYALGVLAIRALLADADNPLSAAWDDVQTLAGQVRQARENAPRETPPAPLAQVIAGILRADPPLSHALGPGRLVRLKVAPEHPLVPMELWSGVLAAIVRCFPGAGPDSVCRDLGDAPPAAIETVMDPLSAELTRLLARVRGMLIGDPGADAELVALVQRLGL
jgi:hypothetical protein